MGVYNEILKELHYLMKSSSMEQTGPNQTVIPDASTETKPGESMVQNAPRIEVPKKLVPRMKNKYSIKHKDKHKKEDVDATLATTINQQFTPLKTAHDKIKTAAKIGLLGKLISKHPFKALAGAAIVGGGITEAGNEALKRYHQAQANKPAELSNNYPPNNSIYT